MFRDCEDLRILKSGNLLGDVWGGVRVLSYNSLADEFYWERLGTDECSSKSFWAYTCDEESFPGDLGLEI